MSTSSIRRPKDRGGAGIKSTGAAAAKPTKNLTPVSEKSISAVDSAKRSNGKENPRPTSRVRAAAAGISQKPAIRPMARIDKSSVAAFGNDGSEARVRWSTSSVPRGRSSSPSEFNRVLADLRNDRVSRVSVDRSRRVEIDRSASKFQSGSRVLGKVQQKKGSFKDLNGRGIENCENGVGLFKKTSEKNQETEISSSRALDHYTKEANLSLNSRKPCSEGSNFDSKLDCNENVLGEESKGKYCSVSRSKDPAEKSVNGVDLSLKETCMKSCSVLRSKDVGEKSVNGFDSSLKECSGKSLNRLSSLEILKEKGVFEELGVRAVNKYPSKIHEKLAFLEGKVKRIASDIKRTKEMLDKNNPDASKVILSDIQEKISGIEKAIGHVENGAEEKTGSTHSAEHDAQNVKILVASQKNQSDHMKSLGKGLNTDELEARFFPHHKLLRDRTSLQTLLGSSQSDEPQIVEAANETKTEDKLLSPGDENHIALEFLASLGNEQSKVTTRGANGGLEVQEVQEMDNAMNSDAQGGLNVFSGDGFDEKLLADETLDEFDDQENIREDIEEENEDNLTYQLNEIGCKASTGGWFVSEGESVLLAHDDGSCSFYDIANCEQKSEYKPPVGTLPNIWRDCWILRAPSADGCAGRYVVAASAGNTTDSGFCSWDFYSKDVKAFHLDGRSTNTRTALASLPNNPLYRRNSLCPSENRQWWYKPCGPLIMSAATCQKAVQIYDIRDGEQIMKWELGSNVLGMEYSSPLQWRNRGKVVLAEAESVSLWDVSSQIPQQLLNVSSSGRRISALHVNNTDAELGGGVRQRVSSSEPEGNDGVFCTSDSINVLDFRNPSGIALKISKHSVNVQSVFSRGDNIFLGCTSSKSAGKNNSPQIQHFSLRKQSLVNAYTPPESNSSAITQVWGNSNTVMGLSRLGLFVFDAFEDDGLQSFAADYGRMQNVKEIIGPDDLYSPTFDYLGSRVLLISRDRPALWRYLS
ncbi:hypothetical protein LguiA_030611 [Lonicera macranthoides]